MAEFGIPQHKDSEVQSALIRLLDALCTWERMTGRESILILREDDYTCRAANGKCGVPDDITDAQLIRNILGKS